MEKKVVLIDRHPLVYIGLEKVLKEHGYHLINGYSKGEDIYTVILQNQPSFIIIDTTQSLICGAEFLHVASTLNIKDKIIVFSEYDNVHYQRECLASGISAYIPKHLDSLEIISAMASMERGEKYYPALGRAQISIQIDDFDRFIKDSLTEREQLILKKLSAGYSNKEISDQLHLSSKTVSTHKKSLFKKLCTDNLVQAVDIARLHALP
ncbi:response regulator transcription factor [Pseudomonas fluorescens]|uniref:response regulator transcription factor n=1 Tax=Pseudomonas fluorescens TaxID=294 RepID=UPI000935F407|nr:response regulator transcription factor [Pseudomonas fluorescens]